MSSNSKQQSVSQEQEREQDEQEQQDKQTSTVLDLDADGDIHRLRPAEQSATRVVPASIPRPDYADHPEGFPLSEQKLKGNTYVRQLDDEEVRSGAHTIIKT